MRRAIYATSHQRQQNRNHCNLFHFKTSFQRAICSATRTGDVILGLDQAQAAEGVTVFCAGVGEDDQGNLLTAGGRVLAVTGQGSTLAQARERAYAAAELITWPGKHCRSDIAKIAQGL